ncbi:MAG: AAA family ATPase, partial [Desulfobacterales bacterium]|nr:AAA family ATPase [Desulfobacterales bacterium]
MKIDRLQLIAYGPFTDKELDFTDGGRAFHLIYGANEAGKSSALRALRSLLFGIPVRTRDNFRHPHPQLRIGARLTRSDGATLAFIRRKGQLKTLRGTDSQSVLEETALQPFLGGVDRELFEQMFAIGHDELIQGGEEIIAGGGSVGQALFAAGAGLLRLQTFWQRLETEADDLFKTAGKKPRINRTLSDLKATRHQQRTTLLRIKTWQTHHAALDNARERLAAVEQDLAARQQQQDRLRRIQEALPLMARRQEINAALEGYAGIPDLSENFRDTRREAETRRTIADRDRQRAQTVIEELRQQINALEVPEQLLAHAALVEALQQDLGSFNKARQDRPGLEARMQLLYRQAASDLSAEDRDAPKAPAAPRELSPVLISEIQALGQRHERLQTRLETTRADLRHLATEISILEEQQDAMPAPVNVGGLKIALQAAQDAGPLEKQLATTRSDIAAELKNLNQALQRQDLWSGNLEELDDLVIPSEARITQFETRFEALARQFARQQAEQEQKTEELARNDIELRTMVFARDVPTEADLTAARARRDTGWRLVRRRLENRPPAPDEEHQFANEAPLTEAFETSMRRADRIADRLRREADQVSRKSLLEARQK